MHPNVDVGGRPLRLESIQNANEQAAIAAKAIAGTLGPAEQHDAVSWFWSNQYDLRLQTGGLWLDHDEIVVRGDPRDAQLLRRLPSSTPRHRARLHQPDEGLRAGQGAHHEEVRGRPSEARSSCHDGLASWPRRTGRAKRGRRSRGGGSADDVSPAPRILARTEPPTRWDLARQGPRTLPTSDESALRCRTIRRSGAACTRERSELAENLKRVGRGAKRPGPPRRRQRPEHVWSATGA